MNARVDMKRLLPSWKAFRRDTDISPIRSEAHYRRMVATLEALLAEAGNDEKHPAMGLIDVVGDLIAGHEAQHPLREVNGVQALRFLMAQHGLAQSELPEVGSQGVVSEILSGKRELNLRQGRLLAERFGVSPATFI